MLNDGPKLIVNEVHLILKNYLTVDTTVESLFTGFDSVSDEEEHYVGFTMSVSADNSAFI